MEVILEPNKIISLEENNKQGLKKENEFIRHTIQENEHNKKSNSNISDKDSINDEIYYKEKNNSLFKKLKSLEIKDKNQIILNEVDDNILNKMNHVNFENKLEEKTGLKFPNFADAVIDIQINEEITFEKLILDINECINQLDYFEKQFYELLTGKEISNKIIEKFYKNHLDFSIIKIYVFFLKRQLNLVSVLLQIKYANTNEENLLKLKKFLNENYRCLLSQESYKEKYEFKKNINENIEHLYSITQKMIEQIQKKNAEEKKIKKNTTNNIDEKKNKSEIKEEKIFMPDYSNNSNKNIDQDQVDNVREGKIHFNNVIELKKNSENTAHQNNDLSEIDVSRETIFNWMIEGDYRLDENINKMLQLEKEIIDFFDKEKDFMPSLTSIGTTIKIMLVNTRKALLIIKDLSLLKKIKSEEIAINFLTLCNRFELFANFFLLSFKIPESDLFNQPEHSESWEIIKENLDKKILFSRKNLTTKFDKVFSLIQVGMASVSKGFKNKNKSLFHKVVQTGFYMPYYFLFPKNANIQSQKFAINPDSEIAMIIWNIMDCKYIKNLIKVTMPRIKHSKKYFLKKENKEITIESLRHIYVKFLKNIKSQNSNNQSVSKEILKDNNENIKNFSIIQETIDPNVANEFVKIRFISNRKFIVPHLQSFWSKITDKKDHENSSSDSLIIHIHGGGFIAMSSASHEMYTRKWAKFTDIPIMSIDYRLAPDHPYPQPLDDVYQAYNWIINNAEEKLAIKLNNIILVGDSAGGNLVAALTQLLIVKNERLPTAIFLIYPALRISMKSFTLSMLNVIDDKILPYHLVRFCLEAYRNKYEEEYDPFISPIYVDDEVLRRFPPVRIYVGTNDPLRDDCFSFMKRLLDLKKEVKLTEYTYFPHGFMNFDTNMMMPEVTVITEKIARDFQSFCK